jgi:uncharacterized protein with ParB-like and HNH nuclease domain
MSESTEFQEALLAQLETAKKLVKTDDYAMSIGELANLYKDEEITLNPTFQRAFRWEEEQKTKLVESILIGIPIPEIFVSQKSDGTWNVVDGVQRLSTIFQLMGVLEQEDPLELTSCKYLPDLMDKKWEDFPISLQRQFRKSKVRVNIILMESNEEAQYELFQRLNTGGTSLSEQEVRNCLIIMVDESFYKKINELKDYENFKACLKIKEKDFSQEYHMELILRMFIGFDGNTNYSKFEPLNNALLSDFIDRESIRVGSTATFDEFENSFKRTFDKLKTTLSDKAFLKYNEDRDDFLGQFNVSAFEMLTVGISSNIDKIEQQGNDDLIEKIKELYGEEEVVKYLKRGIKAIPRFRALTNYSRIFFGK